jgi:hypothetical protein
MSCEETVIDGADVLIVAEAAPLADQPEGTFSQSLLAYHPGDGPWIVQVRDGAGKPAAGLWVSAEDIAALAGYVANRGLIERSGELGADAGREAASWVFDGNTLEATYRHVLLLITTCSPEMDTYDRHLPEIDEAGLVRDLGLDDWTDDAPVHDCLRAWEEEAREAFWREAERAAREHVNPEPAGEAVPGE